jgi:hypothetical protein
VPYSTPKQSAKENQDNHLHSREEMTVRQAESSERGFSPPSFPVIMKEAKPSLEQVRSKQAFLFSPYS